jgi:hypothetical protein
MALYRRALELEQGTGEGVALEAAHESMDYR